MPRKTFRTHDATGNALPPAVVAHHAAQKKRDAIMADIRKIYGTGQSATVATLQAALAVQQAECETLRRIAKGATC